MNKLVHFLGLFCLILLCSSNVSQPGVFSSGGSSFTMLFPEDSSTYKKVQMQEEVINIQLYKGYAVVKGTYKMVNTSAENLTFTMGYPVKGIYNGGEVYGNEIELDSIYKFKVKSNQQQLSIIESAIGKTSKVNTFQNENWLTWKMNFTPNQTNYVEVYFIVNTNNAQVVKGYSRSNCNAFTYLLESGKVWKQPIEKGNFIIELKDNLKLVNIQGISDYFSFKKVPNKEILIGYKTNFSPTPKDNLIVTYNETVENFNFETVLKNEEKLYNLIDILSNSVFSPKLEGFSSKNPYDIKTDAFAYLPLILTLAVIYLPPLLIGIVVFIIFRFIFKRIKKSKSL